MTEQLLADDLESDEVRARILHSASILFAERGFSGTTIREIAERANTTKPMIYYYFENKQHLYDTIVTEYLERLASQVEKVIGQTRSLEAGVRRFTASYLRFFMTYGDSMRLVAREMFGLGEKGISNVSTIYLARLRSALGQLLTRSLPDLEPAETEDSIISILGIINMYLVRYVVEPSHRLDPRAVIRQVTRVYLPGMLRSHVQRSQAAALDHELHGLRAQHPLSYPETLGLRGDVG